MKVFKFVLVLLTIVVSFLSSVLIFTLGLDYENKLAIITGILAIVQFAILFTIHLTMNGTLIKSIYELNEERRILKKKSRKRDLYMKAVKEIACEKAGLRNGDINRLYSSYIIESDNL